MENLLLSQFRETFNNPDWFATLNGALEGVDKDQFSFKVNGESNSIEQIVHHLVYYDNLYLQRFKNKDYQFARIDNDATFSNPDNLDMDQSIKRIKTVFAEIENVLEVATDRQLSEMVGDSNVSWRALFGKLILHNAYHIGQIVAIRKFNNFWNRENGVN